MLQSLSHHEANLDEAVETKVYLIHNRTADPRPSTMLVLTD